MACYIKYSFTSRELYDAARHAGARMVRLDEQEGVYEVEVPAVLEAKFERRLGLPGPLKTR
ncbi:MAG: hypothetical protein QXU82_01830 [Candidatus Aenigmatarchaeota archaeon]